MDLVDLSAFRLRGAHHRQQCRRLSAVRCDREEVLRVARVAHPADLAAAAVVDADLGADASPSSSHVCPSIPSSGSLSLPDGARLLSAVVRRDVRR